MQPTTRERVLKYGLPIAVVGLVAAGVAASGQGIDVSKLDVRTLFESPCERPIQYTLGAFDERFGISRTELESALAESASLWNAAAGKTLVERGETNAVVVNLAYGEHQQNAQLGQAIDAEQSAYESKRAEVEATRSEYLALRARFEASEAAFKRDNEEYDESVAYWNARGGAPSGEYEKLQEEQRSLERKQRALNALVDEVNALAKRLGTEVDELNALVRATNAKVNVYNEDAGSDFNQGTYISDEAGERINIYEFTNKRELKRVLAHEFGHALGIDGHVENPESIMYSYNIDSTFELTQEDIAALKIACELE